MKSNGWVSLNLDGPDTTAIVFVGGRCRIPCVVSPTGGLTDVIKLVWDSQSTYKFVLAPISQLSGQSAQMVDNLRQIYGAVTPTLSEDGVVLEFAGISVNSHNDRVLINEVYSKLGFVEGQARIITDYGNIACVVKNGTLYPIITEYDQQIEDNKCLTSLYLNGDNMVLGLQEMVDRSGEYLPYDDTTIGEPWSPVENYLHQNVNLPIVPKIGFEPSPDIGIGNALPGLNYEVTL